MSWAHPAPRNIPPCAGFVAPPERLSQLEGTAAPQQCVVCWDQGKPCQTPGSSPPWLPVYLQQKLKLSVVSAPSLGAREDKAPLRLTGWTCRSLGACTLYGAGNRFMFQGTTKSLEHMKLFQTQLHAFRRGDLTVWHRLPYLPCMLKLRFKNHWNGSEICLHVSRGGLDPMTRSKRSLGSFCSLRWFPSSALLPRISQGIGNYVNDEYCCRAVLILVLTEAGEHFNSAAGEAVAKLREQALSQELPPGK